jgi:hypothetical protein
MNIEDKLRKLNTENLTAKEIAEKMKVDLHSIYAYLSLYKLPYKHVKWGENTGRKHGKNYRDGDSNWSHNAEKTKELKGKCDRCRQITILNRWGFCRTCWAIKCKVWGESMEWEKARGVWGYDEKI